MHQIALTMLLFLCTGILPAQELAKLQLIGKPEKSASEIVALRDANGRFCAAVQVISDMDGFRYDSYNGVVKVDDQPGQDMVYLQPDERVLEIFRSGYEPLKIILSEIGIQLRPKEVWKIKLSGEKSLSRIPSVFITRPEGARIYIDGEDKGITKKVTLGKGTHTIRLTKAGYEPVLKTIQVDDENTLFEYTLKEIEDVPLQITTEPAAATVYIDNLKFGQTPLSDFYPSGKYPVRVEKEWYVTYEDFIEINAPNTKQNYKLRPDFGSLTVTSAPQSGLDIYLNGQPQGQQTPHTFTRLRPGQYRVQVRSRLHEAPEEIIEVTRQGRHEVRLTTEANFGSLTVTSVPQSGLNIYLNGENQNIKTPHTFDLLKPGKYRVSARAKLYETLEQNIEIRRAGKHSINLTSEGNFAVLNIKTLAGAQVTINGKRMTELTGIRLEPQIARVKADLPPKAKPVEKRIALKKGQTLDLDIFPEIPAGTIQVAVVPFEAKIELKGDAGEFYTASQSKSFRNIPTGRYKLKVSQKGYKTFNKDVFLKEGDVVKERVTLVKGSDVPIPKTFVFVEGGTFRMGSTSGDGDEKPVHSITISSFYMSKYEVTQREWRQVMGNNPSRFKGDTLPVENVSWYAAVEFCNKKSRKEGLTPSYTINGKNVTCDFTANGYRLPTEAEWEYAARGGNQSRGYKYGGSNSLKNVAWYDGNSGRKTHPAGQKQANELGLYDLSGNVWEWCWDWYDSGYYKNSPRNNPKGPTSGSGRVLRGGRWHSHRHDTRVAYRYSNNPTDTFNHYGFRIVWTF